MPFKKKILNFFYCVFTYFIFTTFLFISFKCSVFFFTAYGDWLYILINQINNLESIIKILFLISNWSYDIIFYSIINLKSPIFIIYNIIVCFFLFLLLCCGEKQLKLWYEKFTNYTFLDLLIFFSVLVLYFFYLTFSNLPGLISFNLFLFAWFALNEFESSDYDIIENILDLFFNFFEGFSSHHFILICFLILTYYVILEQDK